MSISEKLKATLLTAGALCDDCLSSSAAVRPRQQVNVHCRGLAASGSLIRNTDECPQCHRSKIVNRMQFADGVLQDSAIVIADPPPQTTVISSAERPWYWEGNVQDAIVRHLKGNGWEIRSSANTASRETGKDIVAAKHGEQLWVSVKGWPEKSSNVQARHWFSGALFDLVLYRGQDPRARLAIGIPFGFRTYENLIPRVSWLRSNLPFEIFAVTQNGNVEQIQ